ncbi:RNA-binding domain-containing protein [Pedobacter sp. BMA]|uniref:RNA-binding domain-containing protein n=1 Tax=Pedobacter sp. BMA TaxID=1663685 RepID=UPI00069FCBE7|nr:RNA-binding domain-containing protein [Pedobacter sp. BMA]
MENKKLLHLINKGENEMLAFLVSLDLDRIAVVLSGFLNHKGGNLLLGVAPDKYITGIDTDYIIDELRHQLSQKITPESPIEIIEESIDDKTVLIFKVLEGSKQPYICNGIIYFRKNTETVAASASDIAKLLLERRKNELHWERQVTFGVDWEDLDESLILNVMRKAQSNGRSTYKGEEALEFLNHYGLFNNGSFTNACVILFALNPVKYFPQTRVRITEYAEGKTDKALLRDDVFEGNLFKLRDQLENYVDYMGTRSVFAESEWRRIDFKYPEKALQEGIINALIHRDYSHFNSHLTISVDSNAFIIANSGHLPRELKVADLKTNHRSFPANPDIAHIIFLMGYIDKLGRGTIKIMEDCKKAGMKEPKWTTKTNEVTLAFYAPQGSTVKTNEHHQLTVGFDDTVRDAVDVIVSDAVGDAVSDAVKVRLCVIVNLLYVNEAVALKTLVDHFNSSRATIQRDLLLLNTLQLLKLSGSDKYRVYDVSDALRKNIDALKGK